uniref:Uncharacterized protein n=1 Tax=Triticum urartu TaxID=4572 RepID=A0A8R7QW35_TRIUA
MCFVQVSCSPICDLWDLPLIYSIQRLEPRSSRLSQVLSPPLIYSLYRRKPRPGRHHGSLCRRRDPRRAAAERLSLAPARLSLLGVGCFESFRQCAPVALPVFLCCDLLLGASATADLFSFADLLASAAAARGARRSQVVLEVTAREFVPKMSQEAVAQMGQEEQGHLALAGPAAR